IILAGYRIGKSANSGGPQDGRDEFFTIRDNLTTSFSGAGTHRIKAGGEFLHQTYKAFPNCLGCDETIVATGGPIPANIESLFPVWNDPSTWNRAALSPITVRYARAFGNFYPDVPLKFGGAWLQDDWRVSDALTLNLGVRGDYCKGCLAE